MVRNFGVYRRLEMDRDKIDDVILALLYLTLARDGRAWKGFNWNSMNRLHEKGFIGDPVNRVKSFWLNEEGIAPSEKLFREMFSIDSGRPTASGSCG